MADLFLPKEIGKFDKKELSNLSKLNYIDLGSKIIANFCQRYFNRRKDQKYSKKSLLKFFKKRRSKFKKIGGLNLLELYHGPTLAFKDIAMQVIGNMYDELEFSEKSLLMLSFTSGDTGSAAISVQ